MIFIYVLKHSRALDGLYHFLPILNIYKPLLLQMNVSFTLRLLSPTYNSVHSRILSTKDTMTATSECPEWQPCSYSRVSLVLVIPDRKAVEAGKLYEVCCSTHSTHTGRPVFNPNCQLLSISEDC
jgi:hypothetical protein